MRMIRTNRTHTCWGYRLYVVPETWKEKIYLYRKGYRVCKIGMLTKGHFYVHEKHRNL